MSLRLALLAALLLASEGCLGTSGGGGESTSLPRPAARGISTLTVANNNWLDVVVYVSVAGSRTSIVRAGTNRTVTAEIPSTLVKNGIRLRLLADFAGAVADYWSEDVFLRPGQDLFWTLEDNLRYSSLQIH